MAFQVSPGVNVSEIDFSGSVVGASVSTGATVMPARWGPANTVQIITTEEELEMTYGRPNTAVAEYWLCAASYLNYSSDLRTTRTVNSTAMNASSGGTEVLIKNQDVYNNTYNTDFGGSESSSYGLWVARYAGDLGDSLKVSICGPKREQIDVLTGTAAYSHSGPSVTLTGVATKFKEELQMGDVVILSAATAGDKFMVLSITSDTVCTLTRSTAYSNAVASGTVKRLARSPFREGTAQMQGTALATKDSLVIT